MCTDLDNYLYIYEHIYYLKSFINQLICSFTNYLCIIRGGKFLEAPVSGSKVPADMAQLIFLCAGDEEVRGRIELSRIGWNEIGWDRTG